MKSKINCITCNNQEFKKLFRKNNYDFIKCKNCGLVTLYPFPSEKQLESYYKSKTISGNYDLNLSIERDRSLKKIIKLILSEKKKGNFIDIGCFDGRLLQFAESAGFTSFGLELQEEAAKKAMQKFPNRIHNGVIEKSGNIFPNKKFSVIVASGVIEHLRSPEYLIDFVHKRLEKDGYVQLNSFIEYLISLAERSDDFLTQTSGEDTDTAPGMSSGYMFFWDYDSKSSGKLLNDNISNDIRLLKQRAYEE